MTLTVTVLALACSVPEGQQSVVSTNGPDEVEGTDAPHVTSGSTDDSVALNVPSYNTTSTLDSTGSAGGYTSITIGADSLGLISYYDDTNQVLKIAHCDDAACTSATTSTIDSTGWVGIDTSITIGADGLGLISYFFADSTDSGLRFCNSDDCALRVAHCENLACTSATTSTLDSWGEVGLFTSITTGTDGLGLISYLDKTNSSLKIAHCDNAACTTATTSTVDSRMDVPGSVGLDTSITIGADGLGLISYKDVPDTYRAATLKVAHCENTFCSP